MWVSKLRKDEGPVSRPQGGDVPRREIPSRRAMTDAKTQIHEGCTLVGPLFSEPMRVESLRSSA